MLGAIFLGAMVLPDQSRECLPSMALLDHEQTRKPKFYGTSKPSKRQLTVYGTSRSRAVNKNAKTFEKQK